VKWRDARESLLADPEVRAYYDSLAPLYALVDATLPTIHGLNSMPFIQGIRRTMSVINDTISRYAMSSTAPYMSGACTLVRAQKDDAQQ
jgi:hypothetical protein